MIILISRSHIKIAVSIKCFYWGEANTCFSKSNLFGSMGKGNGTLSSSGPLGQAPGCTTCIRNSCSFLTDSNSIPVFPSLLRIYCKGSPCWRGRWSPEGPAAAGGQRPVWPSVSPQICTQLLPPSSGTGMLPQAGRARVSYVSCFPIIHNNSVDPVVGS